MYKAREAVATCILSCSGNSAKRMPRVYIYFFFRGLGVRNSSLVYMYSRAPRNMRARRRLANLYLSPSRFSFSSLTPFNVNYTGRRKVNSESISPYCLLFRGAEVSLRMRNGAVRFRRMYCLFFFNKSRLVTSDVSSLCFHWFAWEFVLYGNEIFEVMWVEKHAGFCLFSARTLPDSNLS